MPGEGVACLWCRQTILVENTQLELERPGLGRDWRNHRGWVRAGAGTIVGVVRAREPWGCFYSSRKKENW